MFNTSYICHFWFLCGKKSLSHGSTCVWIVEIHLWSSVDYDLWITLYQLCSHFPLIGSHCSLSWACLSCGYSFIYVLMCSESQSMKRLKLQLFMERWLLHLYGGVWGCGVWARSDGIVSWWDDFTLIDFIQKFLCHELLLWRLRVVRVGVGLHMGTR